MKTCKKCKVEKSLDEFYINSDGYYFSECKTCNKQRVKEYKEKTKDISKEYHKEWRKNNKEKLNEYQKERRRKIKESKPVKVKKNKKEYQKEWREKNSKPNRVIVKPKNPSSPIRIEYKQSKITLDDKVYYLDNLSLEEEYELRLNGYSFIFICMKDLSK